MRLEGAALMATAWLLASGCGSDAGPAPRAARTALLSAPIASLTDGAPLRDSATHGPLIVNFWASWCTPCRTELPALERFAGRYAERGVAVVGITLDDDLNLARELVRAHAISFPNYAQTGGEGLAARFGVKALPHAIVVAADGTLVAALPGARDWDSADTDARLREALVRAGAAPQ